MSQPIRRQSLPHQMKQPDPKRSIQPSTMKLKISRKMRWNQPQMETPAQNEQYQPKSNQKTKSRK